jgi:Cupin
MPSRRDVAGTPGRDRRRPARPRKRRRRPIAVLARLIADEPWGVAVDPPPGAVFHALVAGSCWLRVPGRTPRRLTPGDVALLPTNTPHALASSVDGRTEPLTQFEEDARARRRAG